MNNKPDKYFNNGVIEMAQFGRNIYMRNQITPEQHAKAMLHLREQYPIKKKEIDDLIKIIREKIAKCDPLQLLSFCSDHFLFSNLGISSEFDLSTESMHAARMTEYVQSILVSSENHYVKVEDDPSMTFLEIQADIEKLYKNIHEFYYYWGAKLIEEHKEEYDNETLKTIIEAQNLYLVRGQRYQVFEVEYFEKLLKIHDDEFLKIYGINAKDIIEGIKKLERALSQGKFDAFNELGKIFDSLETCENPFENNLLKEEGRALFEKIFGTKLRDVIEITGWSEKFVSGLSFEINEEKSFFDEGDFSGWPIKDLPIQKRPFIKIKNKYYCFDYYSFVDNFYRAIQKNLKRDHTNYNWAYRQKLASEKMVADIFAKILPGSDIYSDNYYPTTSKKKMAENDIIVLYHDTAIIVEVKAGSFVYTPPITDFTNHIVSYKKLIEEPNHQCKRTYDYIMKGTQVKIYHQDGSLKSIIDMSGIKDIYMMSVTIDNINDFAARAEKLSFLQLQCNAICLSVDDLMVYREYFESPLIFLHYLKQRRRATLIPKLAPNDELDHLGLYISDNYYSLQFEELPDTVILQLNGFRKEIDDYFCKLYHSNLNPPKPELKIPQLFKEIIKFVEENDVANKSEIINYLLDFCTEAKEEFCQSLHKTFLRQKDIKDYSVVNTSGDGNSLRYTCFVNQDCNKDKMTDESKIDYVLSTILWNDEVDRAMIEIWLDKNEKIKGIAYKTFFSYDIKDDDIERLKVLGSERAERIVSKYKSTVRKKIGRNDMCPCGSGKKYKKCCGAH